MNASVGTCTVPKFRIFFSPVEESPIPSQVSLILIHAAQRRLAAARRKAKRSYSLSSLSTAMNASVGTCTVPRFLIFFFPSFCFSSSFFLRVMSPP